MTSEQIGGLVRALLGIIGGIILGKGWLNAETWAWIVGGAVSAVPAIWSWISNRPASIAASAQGLAGVNVTTNSAASPAVAAAVAAAK
jgi:hypothetical protein